MGYRCDNDPDLPAAVVIQHCDSGEVLALCQACVGPWALRVAVSNAQAQGLAIADVVGLALAQAGELPAADDAVATPPPVSTRRRRSKGATDATSTDTGDGGLADVTGGDSPPRGGTAVPESPVVAMDTGPASGGDHPATQ